MAVFFNLSHGVLEVEP